MNEINSLNLEDLRYEKKFVISTLDLHELEHLIKTNSAMFSEIFYERTINNIYFDTLGLNNYNENLDGVSRRLKIRIRWYGEMFTKLKKPILELKIKNNELGKKLSFPLKPFLFDQKISLKLLQKNFLESNLPKWLLEELKLYCPTLLNSYKRKYFISANKKFRITVDQEMIFIKIKDQNNLFNEKIIDKENYIFELKYALNDHKDARNFIQEFPFRLVANSKYVCGINLLYLW